MDIFKFDEYKSFLRHQIAQNSIGKGYKTQLAQAAGCQSSFLSQVLHTEVQLTLEHGLGLALFWKMPQLDRDYFLELIQLARAGTKDMRALIVQRLRRLKEEHDSLSQRYDVKKISDDRSAAIYYSVWYHSAVHVLTSIPGFDTSAAIARRLNLSLGVVGDSLDFLEKSGLVEEKTGKYRMTGRFLHVPKTNALNVLHANSWRERAVCNVGRLCLDEGESADIHYTSVCSISADDFRKLRDEVVAFLDVARRRIVESAEEELVSLNVDFFVVR